MRAGRSATQRNEIKRLFLELKSEVTPEAFKKIVLAFDLGIDALSDHADDVIHEWERLNDIIEQIEPEPVWKDKK